MRRVGSGLGHRLVALLVAGAVLAACTGGPAAPSTPSRVGAGGTLRVGLATGAFFAFDPQDEWNFATWELFRCCLLRTLMSYDTKPGAVGTQPVPDLASGPPTVSTDGLTWTFHLRSGLRYGPPFADVPITSFDLRRAILRAADPHNGNPGLGLAYLSEISGFADFAAGKTDSIVGIETPDPLTLLVHETHPDASLAYDFTLAITAPIPPSPTDPNAPLGVATGHDRSGDPSIADGYGPFLVSSGPYMIEGEGAVDFSQLPTQQQPASGLVPWGYRSNFSSTSFGSLTLVRNPSWDPASDPLRLALPDRIEIQGGNDDDLWRQFSTGNLDTVFDETPPPTLVNRYLDDPSLRPQIHTLDTSSIVLADFNVSQPPFDDAATRFAVAYALDRRSMVKPIAQTYGFGGAVIANHYASDPSEDSLAAGWSPFPGREGAPDLKAARAEMATSRYATGGRCAAPQCSNVKVVVHGGLDALVPSIAKTLAHLGIHADVRVTGDFYGSHGCSNKGVAMCVGDGWFPDYPSAGNVLIAEFGSGVGPNLTRLGSTPAVPSAQAEIDRCNQMVGQSLVECWTGLDQYLITQLMPAVPLAFAEVVRVVSPGVSTFAWDEGTAMPAIDRLSVAGS